MKVKIIGCSSADLDDWSDGGFSVLIPFVGSEDWEEITQDEYYKLSEFLCRYKNKKEKLILLTKPEIDIKASVKEQLKFEQEEHNRREKEEQKRKLEAAKKKEERQKKRFEKLKKELAELENKKE